MDDFGERNDDSSMDNVNSLEARIRKLELNHWKDFERSIIAEVKSALITEHNREKFQSTEAPTLKSPDKISNIVNTEERKATEALRKQKIEFLKLKEKEERDRAAEMEYQIRLEKSKRGGDKFETLRQISMNRQIDRIKREEATKVLKKSINDRQLQFSEEKKKVQDAKDLEASNRLREQRETIQFERELKAKLRADKLSYAKERLAFYQERKQQRVLFKKYINCSEVTPVIFYLILIFFRLSKNWPSKMKEFVNHLKHRKNFQVFTNLVNLKRNHGK